MRELGIASIVAATIAGMTAAFLLQSCSFQRIDSLEPIEDGIYYVEDKYEIYK